jgi:hypothetical protein
VQRRWHVGMIGHGLLEDGRRRRCKASCICRRRTLHENVLVKCVGHIVVTTLAHHVRLHVDEASVVVARVHCRLDQPVLPCARL